MARGVNKVILVGNVGQDPEMKYMPSGNAVTNISVATSEQWKDKQTGQPQERTEWHRVVFFNRLGEIAGEYLRKGSKVYVEGALRTRKWQDQAGQDRYTTEIVASDLQMLDGRSDGGHQGQGGQQQPQQQPHPQQQRPQGNGGQQRRTAPQQGQGPQQRGSHDPYNQDVPYHNPPYQPPPGSGYAGVPEGVMAQQQTPQPAPGFDNFDDDIPFMRLGRESFI